MLLCWTSLDQIFILVVSYLRAMKLAPGSTDFFQLQENQGLSSFIHFGENEDSVVQSNDVPGWP